MPNRVQPINLLDFRGGLNLRANEFALGEDESPDMLNVVVDPTGGVASRKGWQKWKTDAADIETIGNWDPREAFVHEVANGNDVVLIANNGTIEKSATGDFDTLESSLGVPVVVGAGDHLADFAPWGDDLYVVGGQGNDAFHWNGVDTYATLITSIDAPGDFVNDYTTPGATDVFVQARFAAVHNARMYVAYTCEDGVTENPYRIRWSHPSNPQRWAEDDYVDIRGGGGPITAIVPHQDHLLVFKQNSVWAIYGYSGNDDIQIVNVTRNAGAWSKTCVATAESAVYFVSWPQGVFVIAGGGIEEISTALRPAIASSDFDQTALDQMFLGWMGQRLWWSCPYERNALAGDATAVFVFDPSIMHDPSSGSGFGSWTLFRSASGGGVGPFAQGGFGQGSIDLFACIRDIPSVVKLEANTSANDWLDDQDVGFETRFTTGWLHAGWPELKKRWKRPTFLARQKAQDYRLTVTVYADYEENTGKRTIGVNVAAKTGVITYDDGYNYDEDHQYSATSNSDGTTMRVASGFGSSASVQLQIDGEVGKAWALDGIVAKYRPRRFK